MTAILSSCIQKTNSPEQYSVPEFINVDYRTATQFEAVYAVLSARLSSNVGIRQAGFMVGRDETSMSFFECVLENNTFSIKLETLGAGKTYCFYAKAGNGKSEIRTKMLWFKMPGGQAFPEPDTDPDTDPDQGHGSGEQEPPLPLPPPDGEGITISDKNFEDWLLGKFDIDNDGKLEMDEVNGISELDVCTDNIKTLDGIQYFIGLRTLNCSGTVWNGQLSSLALASNNGLERLVCDCNHIAAISLPSSLLELSCRFNNLSSPNFKGLGKLKKLDCFGCGITNLKVSALENLEVLICGMNSFETLDVSSNLKLKTLDLSDSPKLKTVYVAKGHKIENIIADNSVEFKYKEQL